MNKQEKYDRTYLNMAKEWAKLSHCSRKKVGALIVKNGQIISDGFNGSPSKTMGEMPPRDNLNAIAFPNKPTPINPAVFSPPSLIIAPP